jgi:hypothetical protein
MVARPAMVDIGLGAVMMMIWACAQRRQWPRLAGF